MAHPRKPCNYCGGPKEAGQSVYCIACSKARYRCDTCGGEKPTPARKLCDRCALEHQRTHINRNRKDQSKAPGPTPPGKKWCARCSGFLPLRSFGRNGSGPAAYCRPCNSVYHWARRMQREFGITPEQYLEILAIQGGVCAICSVRPKTRRLAVDHNHRTGEVRGLLCTMCNHKVLGGAKENPDILRRAAAYLDEPPARAVLRLNPGADTVDTVDTGKVQ